LQLARKTTQLPKCLLILKGPIWIFLGAPTAFHTALHTGKNLVSVKYMRHEIVIKLSDAAIRLRTFYTNTTFRCLSVKEHNQKSGKDGSHLNLRGQCCCSGEVCGTECHNLYILKLKLKSRRSMNMLK